MYTERRVAGGDGQLNLATGPANGPPLLFLHGVGRSWQDYPLLMGPLRGRWQVHALDFRGHGDSDPTPDRYRVRDYVRDAVAVVRDHLAQPTVIYGHSLGALVAAGTAAELPGLVRGVVLEDPPLSTLGAGIRSTPFHSLFTLMRSASGTDETVPQLARRLADSRIVTAAEPAGVRLGDVRDATAIRFGAACLKRVDATLWDTLVGGGWMEGYDPHAIARAIRCPVLLLQGREDEGGMLSDAVALEFASLIGDCSRVVVPGAGHLIHGTQRETTLRLVNEFLESIALDRSTT